MYYIPHFSDYNSDYNASFPSGQIPHEQSIGNFAESVTQEPLPKNAISVTCEGRRPSDSDPHQVCASPRRDNSECGLDQPTRSGSKSPTHCSQYNWRRRQNPDAEHSPCYRLTCRNTNCRRHWSMREHNILAQSFQTKPPTFFTTVSFGGDWPKRQDLSRWMRAVNACLRYRDPAYQHWQLCEIGKEGNFHIHSLSIASLTCDAIHKSISNIIEKAIRVYVDPVREPFATARYVTKDMVGETIDIPESYCGRGKRLTICSRGFLSASRDRLWANAKQMFAAKANEA